MKKLIPSLNTNIILSQDAQRVVNSIIRRACELNFQSEQLSDEHARLNICFKQARLLISEQEFSHVLLLEPHDNSRGFKVLFLDREGEKHDLLNIREEV